MNLWELCREFNVKNNVIASSSSVYGNNEKIPFSETDNVDKPISPYAATKKCTEILGHVYHHLYEMNMIFLRFFTVFGPRQRPDLAIHKFTKLISENKEIPFYGDGSTARDYTFIDDIVDGIIKSIEYVEKNSNVYETINLGESQNYMYWTLELASYLSDAPWPMTKAELIDYAIRTGAPMEVVENLQAIEDEGEIYESIEEVWSDYPTDEDFLWNEDEY
ncbi:hypothetical protein Lal_00042757 [Lupinus albus]|nr:hypothetical protein Lal_00042757 [Lupinus albus]